MAIKHLKDGEDFGASHFPAEFGFHGSASGHGTKRDEKAHGGRHMRRAEGGSVAHVEDKDGGSVSDDQGLGYAHGGHHPHMAHGGHHPHMAHGGHVHPHGHEVEHVEAHPHDGHIMRHAHGGYTHIHADGQMTHHDRLGAMCHGGPAKAHGGHYEGGGIGDDQGHTYAKGGGHSDAAQDRTLIRKMLAEHDRGEGDARPQHHEQPHMARGGVPPRVRVPRAMSPVAERRHSPIATPPRNAAMTVTPRNAMDGGQMGYGVEPSDEPDQAGSDQGIPQMRHGGHRR